MGSFVELGDNSKFPSACDPTAGYVGSVNVVSPEAFRHLAVFLLNSFKDVLVPPFV
jgi:hypothetical protein